jgi:hypothetical protein
MSGVCTAPWHGNNYIFINVLNVLNELRRNLEGVNAQKMPTRLSWEPMFPYLAQPRKKNKEHNKSKQSKAKQSNATQWGW